VRVLHLRNSCGFYGAERCIVAWVRELGSRGFGFDVAVYEHPDPSTGMFLRGLEAAGAAVHVLPRRHARGLEIVTRLVRLVRERGIDLIHAHENRSHVVGWLVGGLTATPVVATVHGYVASSPKSRRWNAFNRRFLLGRRVSALTVPTRQLQREMGPDATLVPNAAPEALARGRLAADSPPERATFGVIARLSPEKGIDRFLDAVAALPEEWRFLVVGDGPERPALARHVAASRVEWSGYREDAVDMMRAWTAIVVPSRAEGLPITLLEAMAQGVPVVAARVGGIPDVIVDGENGLLVPPDDAGALERAMREVVAGPSEARERAARARARFLRDHTVRGAGETIERIYRAVARRGR
jgi:glycosyltransferase involved in cell wall biosynthesis